MIEQLASLSNTQGALQSDATMQVSTADKGDVTRFNMELSERTENKDNVELSHLLQDVKTDDSKISNDLLNPKVNTDHITNPLLYMDQSFKDIMSQMNDVPRFDKFMEMREVENKKAVRSNIESNESVNDPEAEVNKMISETKDLYSAAGEFSKDISKWHIKTQIWSASLKVMTTVVSQASQGFKTLFRSAG